MLRIANASGFYGDRFAAVAEMLDGGQIDVLTGDYLAELTMLILAMDRLRDESLGYAKTFLRQMEDSLAVAVERGVRIVVNAGGLNPAGLAAKVRELATRIGVEVAVGHVEGDDLLSRAEELGLGSPIAANAYLGGWGIAELLRRDVQVVVTGRVTDASLVVGPAAAHFGWATDDYDQLAGAVAAGHVVECGTQATGGNFAFFKEIADLSQPGFPIAELSADGSSVITKHPGSSGAVTVDTVTAQLLYEIGGVRYIGPDVTTRFDSITLEQAGADRVRLSGAIGEPPPPTLKVGVNTLGGFRNEVVFVLTGLDIESKAALVRSQMESAVAAELTWTLARTDRPDADTEETASAMLHCVARGSDADSVGRAFSGAAIELALASYPGFHVTAPPSKGSPYGVFTAAHVPAAVVPHRAVFPDGTVSPIAIDPDLVTRESLDAALDKKADSERGAAGPHTATRRVPLGSVIGARSGDKGGSANIGVWARSDRAWEWLQSYLDTAELKRLLPEASDLVVTRHEFANLRAL
ncbi:MAG TPA: acyclic terpene utilization AtuA family protein, partial [Microthrixaceae bacterium]|nr:acyclic terpene utilization AtuA family protein [Microthrixaceae bacterium]